MSRPSWNGVEAPFGQGEIDEGEVFKAGLLVGLAGADFGVRVEEVERLQVGGSGVAGKGAGERWEDENAKGDESSTTPDTTGRRHLREIKVGLAGRQSSPRVRVGFWCRWEEEGTADTTWRRRGGLSAFAVSPRLLHYSHARTATTAMSFFPEDLQVYSFDALEEDDGLAGLLEEGLNEYNDETFGDVEVETSAPVGEWQQQ